MPELTKVSEHGFPKPVSCSECHVDIYSEWARSAHAKAFESETYRRATDDYQFKECIACHAPEPRLTSREPAPRTTDRELGVACVSCHLDHGSMVGPTQPTGFAKPHPVRVDPALFADGVLCGRCHQSTLSQWQAVPVDKKKDCRQCHMPTIRRTITQATNLISRPIVAAESPGGEHRHLFTLIPTDLPEKPFDLIVDLNEQKLQVTLHNLLPHDLPTGDFGMRVVQLTARSVNATGSESPLAKWEVNGIVGASIPAGGSRSWSVGLPLGTQRVKLEMFRVSRDPADQLLLLRKEVACR
jgi:hypothetical protein